MTSNWDQKSSIRGQAAPALVHNGDQQELIFEAQTLKNTRELRTLMVEAAFSLQKNPDLRHASIAVRDPSTLSPHTVRQEVSQFLEISQPHIANRLTVADLRTKATTELNRHHEALRSYLISTQPRKPPKASQEAVIATLLQRYLNGQPGLTMAELTQQTGAALATVYLALTRYQYRIDRGSPRDKRYRLHSFSINDWMQWIERSNRLSSVYFMDQSGALRSSKRLAKGLARLKRDDLAIGGLMGAMHHLPAIDATAAPQLDILLHGSPSSDLSFIQEIDPGLKLTKDPNVPAHVVVHFIDRPQSLFKRDLDNNWGALPDCIANMHRARLTHQVADAIELIEKSVRR